jgi:hypothetical protein
VAVHDLDAVHAIGLPDRTAPPLVVDAPAALALRVGSQCLQLVSRRDAQTRELGGGVDAEQLAPGDALDAAETGNRPTVKQGLGVGARERADQAA